MKKFKKLIPAFCAMLISAVMLGTSTYAWFSVNKKVTVSELTVTAQANTQYFVVSDTTDFTGNLVTKELDADQITQGGIGSNESSKTTVVKPAAYGQREGKGLTGWWTANVDTYDATEAGNIFNETPISAPSEGKQVYENTDYFVGYTFYVGLAANSTAYQGKLDFLDVNGTNGASIAAVKIEQQEKSGSNWGDPTPAKTEWLAIAAGSKVGSNYQSHEEYDLAAGTKCVKVTVYVYLNGNNPYVIDSHVGELGLTGDKAGIKVGGASENLSA